MKKTRKSIFIGILSFAFAFCTIGALATSLNDVIITDAATTATVNKMNFEEGASVRTTAENMGIRFKANYDASIYNLVEAGTATAGMIIVPEKALAGASGDYFSYLQAKFNKKPEDVSTQFTIDYFTENKDGTYQASGAIVNLLDENLVYEYQAVAYYYTETNGYVYSGKSDMRTISYVTNAALQSNDLTEQQRADTLQMATTLSQRLETLGKTSNSQFAIETTVAEGIDLTGYESKDKSIVSAVLNGVAVEMVDNKVVLTEAQEVAATQVLKLTYSDDSVLNIKVNIKKVELIPVDVTIYMGIDDQNMLTAAEIFGKDTEYSITSITDENGEEIIYRNGVVTLPDNLTVGSEYTWTVGNGVSEYEINVFVATNVIRTVADIERLFNYTQGDTYYVDGASGYYVLANNIDGSGYTHTHGMTNSSGMGLTGTFDGRGYTIDGITFANAGLFGFVQGGTIKNVGLTNVTVQTTGEAYVLTQQSSGMTVDNVFVEVTYSTDAKAWNQGMFEKAWDNANISNVMVIAKGGNANSFALGAMWNYEAKYSYTNVYAISELLVVRKGESAGITIYSDVETFKANVTTSSLTNFNDYWNLKGDYPKLESMPNVFEVDATFYVGLEDVENILTAEQVFGDDTNDCIVSITDENGEEIAYDNGVVTLPEGLEATTEYKWTVSNGKDKYIINVFVATNVIRTIADIERLFNYTQGHAYYVDGASGYYALGNNIDASGYTHAHGMTNSSGMGLTGTFDGRGYTIDGITFANAGLFGFVQGGTIKNVGLTNVTVQTTGEAYVLTQQSSGMTVDNVFVEVTYSTDAKAWNQGMFEKAWGNANISNVMVIAKGGNANAFALGAMWNYEAKYSYTNVYAISELLAVRKGESTGITIYSNVETFEENVETSSLTNFNEYWDLTGNYPRLNSMPKLVQLATTIYVGLEDDQNVLTAEQVFGEGTEESIVSITDKNGNEIAYSNGVITLPEGLLAGNEYKWNVSNGKDTYIINVFVATNVIRTIADIQRLFTYSDSHTYYVDGARGYYVLGNNIDATGYTHTHSKVDSTGAGLIGTFDGRGYTIDGITFENAGLFGYVQGGTIKNVALTNVKMQGTNKTEVYVITKQSNGMTIDNVFVSVEYNAVSWNQGLFEKAWGNASISNMMVVATGGNANTFAVGAMYNYETKYSYTNVYVISELLAVRVGASTGITIYADALAFATNVDVSSLTGFNSYWDLTGAYPILKSALKYTSNNLYEGVHIYAVDETEGMLVEGGNTVYKIVKPNNPTAYESNAVYELHFFSQEQRV